MFFCRILQSFLSFYHLLLTCSLRRNQISGITTHIKSNLMLLFPLFSAFIGCEGSIPPSWGWRVEGGKRSQISVIFYLYDTIIHRKPQFNVFYNEKNGKEKCRVSDICFVYFIKTQLSYKKIYFLDLLIAPLLNVSHDNHGPLVAGMLPKNTLNYFF